MICMATLTSFLGAAIAVQSMFHSLSPNFFVRCYQDSLLTHESKLLAGIWTATAAFPMGKSWIHYVMVQHPGIAVFLFLDGIILIAVTTLTTAQASQVLV